MSSQPKIILYRCLLLLIANFVNAFFSFAIADTSQSETVIHDKQLAASNETGVEIGILIFLGPDIRLFYHQHDTPWVFGFRYLDIKDDFINETAVGFTNDESDKLYTKTVGIYTDYIFNNRADTGSFYASGALYQTTKKLKCYAETDSDSATSLYVGGGYQRSFRNQFGYKIGVLFSPFVNLEQSTAVCSNEEGGDFDLDVGLTYKF